jgi:hypothetical protein
LRNPTTGQLLLDYPDLKKYDRRVVSHATTLSADSARFFKSDAGYEGKPVPSLAEEPPMFEGVLESLTHEPSLARFAIALIVFLIVPALCRRVWLPAVVGLLAAGVVLGPHGLHLSPKNPAVSNFFADIGKLLLMFFAGLEIDLTQFQRVRNRSLAFGVASFGLPLIMGIALGKIFGYDWLSALLIGSVFASHMLLGYLIVQRLGLVRTESVTVTIGATIFTDVAALLVVAICIPIHTAGFSTSCGRSHCRRWPRPWRWR